MCEHLAVLESEIKAQNIKETFRGSVWTESKGEWIYFDCYLDCEQIIRRLHLPEFVRCHTNDDNKSGLEEGLVCEKCNDAIMGYHRRLDKRENVITIQ